MQVNYYCVIDDSSKFAAAVYYHYINKETFKDEKQENRTAYDIDLWGTSSTTLAEKSEVHRTYAISKKVYKNENNFYVEISQGKEQPYSAIIRFIGGGDDKK